MNDSSKEQSDGESGNFIERAFQRTPRKTFMPSEKPQRSIRG